MPSIKLLPTSIALVLAAPAFAHGDHRTSFDSPWTMWQWSPEILLGLAIAAVIFWRGTRHGLREWRWRILAFNGGLLALFIALISPVERLADHIFAVHQIEHMLLRTVAPMLIFLSRPEPALVRGLPAGVTRFFAGNGWLRTMVSLLRRPAVATILFLTASYFWMIPRWHDLAILDEPIHYLWHISLLVAGLLFFSVIFDRRNAPHGPGLGTRLGMFAVAALGNIVLGAVLTFKTEAIYSAYLAMGHAWDVSMLTDEQTGGVIMWIPGTMMLAVSALVVVHRWASEETRLVGHRARTGRELQTMRRPANRAMALGLAAFPVLVLALVLSVVAVIDHPPSSSHDFGMAGKIPG